MLSLSVYHDRVEVLGGAIGKVLSPGINHAQPLGVYAMSQTRVHRVDALLESGSNKDYI